MNGRYREVVLDLPAGEGALYDRLRRLAERHRGPRADVRAWLLEMLGALADAMEAEILRQDAQGRLIVPAAAVLPRQTAAVLRRPLEVRAGPLIVRG